MAKYIKQEMIDLSGKGEEKVYYRLQTERNIDFKELTQQIEEHHNLMNRGLVNSTAVPKKMLIKLLIICFSVSYEDISMRRILKWMYCANFAQTFKMS